MKNDSNPRNPSTIRTTFVYFGSNKLNLQDSILFISQSSSTFFRTLSSPEYSCGLSEEFIEFALETTAHVKDLSISLLHGRDLIFIALHVECTLSVQKVSRILNYGLRMFNFWFFCGVMLVLISLTYADKFDHFECSVNFWQLFCSDVFWLVFDFCLFQKTDQRICIKL